MSSGTPCVSSNLKLVCEGSCLCRRPLGAGHGHSALQKPCRQETRLVGRPVERIYGLGGGGVGGFSSNYMWVYVYMYICMYACMYVCRSALMLYICVSAYMYMYIYIHIYRERESIFSDHMILISICFTYSHVLIRKLVSRSCSPPRLAAAGTSLANSRATSSVARPRWPQFICHKQRPACLYCRFEV